ncbi:hypothetical protein [Pseudomonas sp. SWI44]|uniref:hypothetical protein n=1 Tax=Pseudomonas sp. SWI44 TaxID=2083053 RepID=UPI000CE5F8F5|nr:hypothetical protein [Pseudomonas sp. SWI44]AVD86447.1 hypothetical protein C4Q26_04540 [Pseudomonas sp. SWI44]
MHVGKPYIRLSLEQEDTFEGLGKERKLLNSKHRRYLDKMDTPFLHGRLDQQSLTINDKTTTSEWKYEKVTGVRHKKASRQQTSTMTVRARKLSMPTTRWVNADMYTTTRATLAKST